MGDQETTEAIDARDSHQRGIRSFFSKIKQRAVKSLICSSSNVVPSNNPDAPGVAPPKQGAENDACASGSEENTDRAYGVVDLKIESLEVRKIEDEDVEMYEVLDYYDPELVGTNEDEIWEENMWKKLSLMKNGRKPIDFRLYLVDMVRYAANINDLKSMGIYITQLQREYHIYDNFEKIIQDRSSMKSKGRTKFRVDGVAEELICRLATLRVGSDVSWKRAVNLICDRLKKNMEPKPKVDLDELPKILFRGVAVTSTDVSDSWFLYPTIDLTGYELQGNPDAEELRRRLGIYLSLRPIVLVKLNLSYTGLDKKCFLPLLPYIATLPSLQELDLRGNRLDTSILKYFYPYLGKFGDQFRSGFSCLRWVHFNHNVDINRLPTRFIMGIDRRWPPIEHRPTPQELTENRAAVCDFSKIDRVRAKLNEKRALIQKRARLRNVSKEKDRRDRKKAAYLRRIAAVANQVLHDESINVSSSSDIDPVSGTVDPDIDGSDAGRTGRLGRVARRAATRATREAQAAHAAGNRNGNNAEGNNIYGHNVEDGINQSEQTRQNHDNEFSDDDDDTDDNEGDVYVDNYLENVSEDDEDAMSTDSINSQERSTEGPTTEPEDC